MFAGTIALRRPRRSLRPWRRRPRSCTRTSRRWCIRTVCPRYSKTQRICRLQAAGWLLAARCSLLARCWLLGAGCWLLSSGSLLAAGCWLLSNTSTCCNVALTRSCVSVEKVCSKSNVEVAKAIFDHAAKLEKCVKKPLRCELPPPTAREKGAGAEPRGGRVKAAPPPPPAVLTRTHTVFLMDCLC